MNPAYRWNAQRAFTRIILLALSIVFVFGITMLFSKGALAAESSGIVAPGSTWGAFIDRGLYALFGACVAVLLMAAILSRWVIELVAPNFDVASDICDRVKQKLNPKSSQSFDPDTGEKIATPAKVPPDITEAEAVLARGILISTSIRIAAIMLVISVFAILL